MALKPQSSLQRKFRHAERLARRYLPPALPAAWFLTDTARTPAPAAIVQHLPAGWGVIYRHFGEDSRADQAAQLADICAQQGLYLLIANDPRLALSINACGVHWPYAKLRAARKWRGAFRLMTASAHNQREIRRAATHPIDAVFFSTVFPSRSPTASGAIGSTRFKRAANTSAVPLVALGGIKAGNAQRIRRGGFASIEGVVQAFGPEPRT